MHGAVRARWLSNHSLEHPARLLQFLVVIIYYIYELTAITTSSSTIVTKKLAVWLFAMMAGCLSAGLAVCFFFRSALMLIAFL